jgi:hypothetical protein
MSRVENDMKDANCWVWQPVTMSKDSNKELAYPIFIWDIMNCETIQSDNLGVAVACQSGGHCNDALK